MSPGLNVWLVTVIWGEWQRARGCRVGVDSIAGDRGPGPAGNVTSVPALHSDFPWEVFLTPSTKE